MIHRPSITAILLATIMLAPAALQAEDDAAAPATAPAVQTPAHDQTAAAPATAADKEAIHNELRALRDRLVAALNKHDIEAVLPCLHPNIVDVSPDARVSRGREGVRKYFDMMMKGPKRIVEEFTSRPEVDELTILYADDRVGVVYGTSKDKFKLTSGMDFEQTTRWTATVVKEDGQWLIASFHASTDMFDNPLLDMVRKSVKWALLGGFVAGVAVAWFIGRMRRRGDRQAQAAP